MNVADTLRALLRRWYVVIPGLILAVAAGFGTYTVVQPGYERSSTQLLVPGEGLVPPGVTNPYLYLGGLTQAADLVVRVMKSSEVVAPIVGEYAGAEVLVQRDPLSSGPVIQIVVTAETDEAAAAVLQSMVDETDRVLDRLQTQQKVTVEDRMSVELLTMDTTSALQQKSRLVTSAVVVLAGILATLVIASLIDGLIRRPYRRGRKGATVRAAPAEDGPAQTAEDELDEDFIGDEMVPGTIGRDGESEIHSDLPRSEEASRGHHLSRAR